MNSFFPPSSLSHSLLLLSDSFSSLLSHPSASDPLRFARNLVFSSLLGRCSRTDQSRNRRYSIRRTGDPIKLEPSFNRACLAAISYSHRKIAFSWCVVYARFVPCPPTRCTHDLTRVTARGVATSFLPLSRGNHVPIVDRVLGVLPASQFSRLRDANTGASW